MSSKLRRPPLEARERLSVRAPASVGFGVPSAVAGSVLPPVRAPQGVSPTTGEGGEGGKKAELDESVYLGMLSSKAFRSSRSSGGIALRSRPVLTLSVEEMTALSMDGLTLDIIALIDGTLTVAEIIARAPASQGEVLGILWDLSEAKLLVLREPGEVVRCA